MDNTFTYEYIPLRGINKQTLIKYGVKTKINSEGKPVAIGFQYWNKSTKVRSLEDKDFYWAEGTPHEPGLFGKERFSSGEGKTITITEGELDALSIYQVLQVPTVSVQSSSSGFRDCSADRSFLNGFERVYLALDGDLPGREAANRIVKLFDPNKVFQLKFDKYKDANDYLRNGEEAALRNLWHNAKRYQPDDIVSHQEEFDKILKKAIRSGVPYPFPALNEMTYGIRTSESVLLTAPEGVGKTELMHAIEYKLLKETTDAVAAIFIEEPSQRHLQALAGLELRKPVHLPDCPCTVDQQIDAVRKVVGRDERLHIYSHFGSDDPDALLDMVRFLVTARGCKYVLLDHITMAVSGLAGEDERRALDYLSTRLEMMVVELDFALIMVSHVNDDGKTRGSRYISKIANIRIDATRDLEHPDPITKNTTTLTVSKNRFGRKTGFACKLLFDLETNTYAQIQEGSWGPASNDTPPVDNTRSAA